MLLLVDPIPERSPASGALALQSALVHSPLDFLSELCRVVFREAFHKALEDNALGPVRYRFGGIKDLDSVPLELSLINGAVVFVPGKAVCLINDYRLELLALGVRDEPLELRSLVRPPRDMAVAVRVDNGKPSLLTKVGADSKLPFDTLVGLSRAGRIPSIDYCIHVTLLKISSLWYSRSSLRGGNRGG